MAPRPLQEIFANLSDDVVGNYVQSIEEIYSHAKDDVSKALESLRERDVFAIRERLYQDVLNAVPLEKIVAARMVNGNDPTPVYPGLRKRNKASTCHDDLHILAMSVIEKSIHKDMLNCSFSKSIEL